MLNDKINIQILDILQENARITASDIAEKISLSVPAVSERIKKLTDGGYITGFTTGLDSKKLGFDLSAFIAVDSSSSDHYEEIIQAAVNHPFIQECHSVTGTGSHLLKVRVRNSTELENILREIQAWPGVVRSHTMVVLSTYKEGNVLPLAQEMKKTEKNEEAVKS